MYKKILLFIIAAVAAVSCLDGGGVTTSGTLLAHMEYSDRIDYATVFGEDSLYFDNDEKGAKLGIAWDCVYFYHSITGGGAFQGGFLLSYLDKPKEDVSGLQNNKYRVNCAAPKNGINTYLVFEQNPDEEKMPQQDFNFIMSTLGTCTMSYCFVNNTVALAQAAVEQLELGEKIVFKATGYKDDAVTGTAEIVLVERSSPKDSVMSQWTQFKLENLRSVDKVNFELVIPEGKEIPATVCVDDLTAQISLSY